MGRLSKTHEDYIEELTIKNKDFASGNFRVIGKYVNELTKIMVEDQFGMLEILPDSLLRGYKTNVRSAVDKESYLRNRLKYIHNNKYEYEGTIYKNGKLHIDIICPKHGLFKQTLNGHVKGSGCLKCARISTGLKKSKTFEEVIKLFKSKHGDKYTYSIPENERVTSQTLFNIECPIHGIFKQKYWNHLNNQSGCPKCSFEQAALKNVGTVNTWSYTGWSSRENTSKRFKGYCLYLLHIKNEEESFLKIGKTFRSIKDRTHKIKINYTVDIVDLYQGDSHTVFYKEKELLRLFKSKKYRPKTLFCGWTECVDISTKDQLIDIFKNLKLNANN